MSGNPGPSLLLAPSVRTEVVTTTTVTTTSYAPISLPPLPPPPVPTDPKQYPLLHARFPRSLEEFNLVFPDGAQATFRSRPLARHPGSRSRSSDGTVKDAHNDRDALPAPHRFRELGEEELVGGPGWKMLRKEEIPKGEEVDILTAIERFNRRKHGAVEPEDAMDGIEMASPPPHHQLPSHMNPNPHHRRSLGIASGRTNPPEIQMRGPSGSTTSAAAPPSPLPSPTGSPAPSFFFDPSTDTTPPPSAPLVLSPHPHGPQTTTTTTVSNASIPTATEQSNTGPLQPDVQLTTLLTLPALLTQYSALPSALQSHVILTFLRQSPMPVLRNVNAILAPTLSKDFLTQLPAELVSIILSFLPGRALAQCARVSKAWRAIIDSDPILWRELLRTTGSWFGGGAERAFARTLMNRRKMRALRQEQENPTSSLQRSLDLPHPYKVLFKSRQLTRTQWQSNLNPKRVSFAAHGSSVVTCLLFSHNRIISASDDHSIHVYNPLNGTLLKSLEGHGGGVWALAATKDTLVSGSTDRTVRIWDLEKGKCTHVFGGHKSTVRCLAIVKPELLDIEVEDGAALSPGLGSMACEATTAGPTVRKERWPKRTLIVTGSRDHTLRVWRLPKAHEPGFVFVPEEEGPDHVEVADHNPYHLRLLSGHGSAVRALAARGRTLVSGSYDHTVRVWDIITGQCKWVLSGHTQKVYSIVLDHVRNQACSGSMDSSVRIWNLANGQCVHVLTGHTSLVGLLGLSHSYLVSAAADSTLRVWDPSTGELLHTLAAHTGAITCFQHDEFKILSGSDGTLKMWDIRDGTNGRDLLTGITGVWQVVFDGRWCVAASNRHDATFLDVWDFGNDVVGDDDEEWVGEGSVDGEEGESETDEDVPETFFESAGDASAEMEQDPEEEEEREQHDESQELEMDEDMPPASTVKTSKRSVGFAVFPRSGPARNRLFPATTIRPGDPEVSPPPGSTSGSQSYSQSASQSLQPWSSPNPGTPHENNTVPSPLPTAPLGGADGGLYGGVNLNSRIGGLLFGATSASTSGSGSSSLTSASASMQGGFLFGPSAVAATAVSVAVGSGDVSSPSPVPPGVSVSGGRLDIDDDDASPPTGLSSSSGLVITPPGPPRAIVPPPLGQWGSPEPGSAGGSGGGSAFGPGPVAGSSRGLGLMGGVRTDETPSRPSRVRRK